MTTSKLTIPRLNLVVAQQVSESYKGSSGACRLKQNLTQVLLLHRHANQFATIIGTVLALVSIAGTLLLFVNPRFDDINRNLGRMEGQLTSLETRMAAQERTLTRLDSKFDAVGNMFIVAYQDQELAASEIETIWRQASNE